MIKRPAGFTSGPIAHPERLALSEAVVVPTKRALVEVRIGMWLSLVALAAIAGNLLYDMLKFALIVSLNHWGQL